MTLQTPRFLLVPATAELVALEITGNEALGKALAAEVPDDWPPEETADALPWFLSRLRSDASLSGWLNWYGLYRDETGRSPQLVGSAGFFGPPEDCSVEIGYSVLPLFQNQGFATEMVAALVAWALSKPTVECVVAETSAENHASRRVLSKVGFLPVGVGRDAGYLRFERQGTLPAKSR